MTDERHQRVKQIFLKASTLDAAERSRYIAEACGDDAAMRQEIDLLLAHHTSATIIPAPASERKQPRAESKSKSRGSRLTAGTVSRAFYTWALRLGLSGQLALGAALAIVGLIGLSFWFKSYVREVLNESYDAELRTLLKSVDLTVSARFDEERRTVEAWIADRDVEAAVGELTAKEADGTAAADDAGAARRLGIALQQRAGPDSLFVLWDLQCKPLATCASAEAMKPVPAVMYGGILDRVRRGQFVVMLPHQCETLAGKEWFAVDKALMGVVAPIYAREAATKPPAQPKPADSTKQAEDKKPAEEHSPADEEGDAIEPFDSRVVAALFIGSPARAEGFSRLLEQFQPEQSGEVYAFDRNGRLLTESRFRDDLVRLGLLAAGKSSVLTFSVRDPGGDLTKGYQPPEPYDVHYRPLAVMRAVNGTGAVIVGDGYRDYRGVSVLGASKWRTEDEFGLIIEFDRAEALRALLYTDGMLAAAVLLLGGTLIAVTWSWWSTARLRRRLAEQPLVGSYVLDAQIGEGGMGRVYRAHHALLKRPTAVKIVKPDLVSEQTLAWFEREVQLASQLSHPNTIEIYDYGSTERGQFYCAMELLRGLTLSQVLLIEGALPFARSVHILRQAVASLAEAHGLGMIHRDIKPHNLMLCMLGGEADFLKVLDFGLAKQAAVGTTQAQTASSFNIAGTPLYMAPERLRPPYFADARSDVYSLGVVAFKLLTGRDLFTADSDLEMFNHALHTPPPPPSTVAQRPIPPDLDAIVLRCLAKSPDDRPHNARELVDALSELATLFPWRQSDAQAWWLANRQRIRDLSPDWDARHFSGVLKPAALPH